MTGSQFISAKSDENNDVFYLRVGVENHFYCGSCYTCDEGRGDICASMSQYGHGKGTEHGGFSEFSIVSSKYCYVFR